MSGGETSTAEAGATAGIDAAAGGAWTLHDLPAKHDALGFGPYLDALTQFLEDSETKPPLTVSIEGDWGSGKTSFMVMLAQRLNANVEFQGNRLEYEGGSNGSPVVWFNAWRHDRHDSLWAAFALSFIEQLKRPLPMWSRFKASLVLRMKRTFLAGAIWDLVRLTLLAAIVLVLGVAVVPKLIEGTKMADVPGAVASGGGLVAILVGLAFAFKWVKDLIGDPFSINLKRHSRQPNYEARIAFIERFHEDFESVLDAYCESAQKVYVFIDDLDRCALPKAAELMEAISLMINDSRLIFVLGLDREKVAMALAVKYEQLTPYLAVREPPRGDEDDEAKRRRVAIKFGHHFLEKFVQLPFVLPVPRMDDVDSFVRIVTLSEKERVQSAQEFAMRPPAPSGKAREEEHRGLQRGVIRAMVCMVADALEFNARAIKQFISRYRLKVYLAADTGLFQYREPDHRERALTIPQLAKFVVLGQRWPSLVHEIYRDPSELGSLERQANSADVVSGGATPSGWLADPELLRLLQAGVMYHDARYEEGFESTDFSFQQLDLDRLLRVAPPTKSGDVDEPRASSEKKAPQKGPAQRKTKAKRKAKRKPEPRRKLK